MKKICVVTGGTGGIGVATVREMAKTYTVLFCGRTPKKIAALEAQMQQEGFDVVGMVCDTSDRTQCEALAAKAASMGRIIGVIHLAGLTPTYSTPAQIFAVDCIGTMNINEAFYKVMDGGCIMDICSSAAHFVPKDQYPTPIFEISLTNKELFHQKMVEMIDAMGSPNASGIAYTFGRAFCYWYARKCAWIFGKKNIRVVTVSIGFVETEMSHADLEATGMSYEDYIGIMTSYTGFGRVGRPDEVAFLFSTIIDERNTYLSGCDIYFDSGCDASGYHGQKEPYDPASNPYDPSL